MTPEQWRQVRVLFEVAGQMPARQRAAFLRNACAQQPALRREVESLLDSAEAAGEFLEGGALHEITWPPSTAPQLSTPEPPPKRIGAYEVHRELGRGGMGAVYLAHRSDGAFQQEVAIKLVRPGMAGEDGLRRFVAERQILAKLVHPNIARLYDGGTTEDGRPYIVMEHVEGEDLLTACDRRKLSTSERLRLFGKVCSAVHYAHQRLVVHRDLKPSNILVTADGEPKLLDFGVAKLLAPSPGGDPDETGDGRPMTPEYASPEQARGEPVTTASDVYSLGVLLYELLCGRRPYVLHSRLPAAVERVISDTAPPRPSTAVTRGERTGATAGPTPEAISATRDGTPARLKRRLAGDLDAIVLAALAKEPEARYGSVERLADDIWRHLDGRSVSVRPRTLRYRFGLMVRRHAWATGATVAAVLGIALVVAVYTARLASERDRARREAAKAQRVSAFLTNLFELSDLDRTKGVKLSVRDIVDRGAENLHRDLVDEPEVAATMMSLIGNVYSQLDLKSQALPLYKQALATLQRLHGDDHPATTKAERDLAALYLQTDQPQRALPLLRHSLVVEERRPHGEAAVAKTLTLQALASKALGDYASADDQLQRAAALEETLGAEAELDLAHTLTTRGHLLLSIDEAARALPLFLRAQELRARRLGPDSPAAGASLLDVGAAQRELGRLDESQAAEERFLALARKAYGEQHSTTAYAYGELALTCAAKGQVERAREYFRRAIDGFDALDPEDSQAGNLYRRGLGKLLVAHGEGKAGIAELEGVLASYQRTLGPDHPRVGAALLDVAEARLALGERDGVEAQMRRGVDILRRQLRPDSVKVGLALVSLGRLVCADGRATEGQTLLDQALAVLRTARPPGHADLLSVESARRACAAAPQRGGAALASTPPG